MFLLPCVGIRRIRVPAVGAAFGLNPLLCNIKLGAVEFALGELPFGDTKFDLSGERFSVVSRLVEIIYVYVRPSC